MSDTWSHAINDFTTWMAGDVTPGTLKVRRRYLLALARAYPAGPATVCELDVARFLANGRWAPETRRSARSSLALFFRWARRHGLLEVDPMTDVRRIKQPRPQPHPAPTAAIRGALAAASARDAFMVRLGLWAGLRRAEIACLHARDVMVMHSGRRVLRVHGKGGVDRFVPVHGRLEQDVRDLAVRGGWAFPGRIDGHLSADRVGVILSRLLGEGVVGHALRHSFATNVLAADGNLRALQELMGHAKPETTMRYTLVVDAQLVTAVDSFTDLPPAA